MNLAPIASSAAVLALLLLFPSGAVAQTTPESRATMERILERQARSTAGIVVGTGSRLRGLLTSNGHAFVPGRW